MIRNEIEGIILVITNVEIDLYILLENVKYFGISLQFYVANNSEIFELLTKLLKSRKDEFK